MEITYDIEHIKWLQRARDKINRVDLKDIVFFEKGERINIPAKIVEDFSFIGLSNMDFITSGFYKNGWDALEETEDVESPA